MAEYGEDKLRVSLFFLFFLLPIPLQEQFFHWRRTVLSLAYNIIIITKWHQLSTTGLYVYMGVYGFIVVGQLPIPKTISPGTSTQLP